MRQPIISPITRPRGTPSTMARVVPAAIRPRAWASRPAGAMRTARDAVIDQNTAWARAIPTRLITSTP